ncbi:MAG: PhoH family protein [Gammaproteobacteria bacterium]|nr:MAG: PhoH family protein [Gammaproteobacteria bacterium]UTW43733.1 PhoH family protein [bacterium SCSIO 12844]
MRTAQFVLEPQDPNRLAALCGHLNENLHLIERYLAVEVNQRGYQFHIVGPKTAVSESERFIKSLYHQTEKSLHLDNHELNVTLQSLASATREQQPRFEEQSFIQTKQHTIKPRTVNQERYVRRIGKYDINFGIGPAGTGKTFLAVACAVGALEFDQVKRIILVRPAVEAGERLGFLPGDLSQKVDPYLRPMYDALYDLMGVETVTRLIAKQVIEIAPLAYMRGRTLNDAFIILDEGQNTTKEQMKMFLTRIGFNSKAVITGDITQVDLPKGTIPGLRHAIEVLASVNDISMTFFDTADVVRHTLVQQVISAYDTYESSSDDISEHKRFHKHRKFNKKEH